MALRTQMRSLRLVRDLLFSQKTEGLLPYRPDPKPDPDGQRPAFVLERAAPEEEGVDCGAVLRELEEGEWKISLRTDGVRINATQVCKRLGGGGHAAAAGATVSGTLEEVEQALLAAIQAGSGD